MRHSILAVVLGVLALASVAGADTVTLKDGRVLEGKVLSRTDDKLVFELRRGGATMRMTFDADRVESVKLGPLAAPATAPAPAPASASPAAPAATESDKAEPVAPPVKQYKTPTYYRIPLRGEVGRTLTAAYLTRALEDARLRKPTVVVLEIDSPGGQVMEVDKLMRAIAAAKREAKVVALVRQAISAAAITTLAVDEIYVSKGAVFGAATAYELGAGGTTRDVGEKFKSIWMSTARSSAELGGHSSVLADAMIDRSLSVYCTETDGKRQYSTSPGNGATVFKPAGRLLTLTATEAVSCGLAAGLADTYQDLAKLLKLDDWTECEGLAAPLAEWRERRLDAAEKQVLLIDERIKGHFAVAIANDPSSFQDYVVYSNNRRMTPDSRRKWVDRSQKCASALQRIEKELTELDKLQKDYPELHLEESIIALQKQRIKSIKAVVQQGPPA